MTMLAKIKEERKEAFQKGQQQGVRQGMQKGLQQGMQKGSLKMLIDLVQDKLLSIADAAKKANMSENDFVLKMNEVLAET